MFMRTKKAISLVVLVITIIVMIILASAVIISLTNNGIINNANDAVDKTNLAQVKQIVELAFEEAYMSTPDDLESLNQAVITALERNGLNPNDYGLLVTKEGVEIVDGWLQVNERIIKGDKTILLGDIVNYDDGVASYTGDWKVLGADENGQILLISESIGTLELKGMADFYEGIDKLNAMCEPYGNGAGAVSARSFKAEDITKIVSYDPATTFIGENCRQATEFEYGNVVTYKNTAGVISTKATNNIQIDDITKTAELPTPVTFKYPDPNNTKNLLELKTGEEYTARNDYYDLGVYYDTAVTEYRISSTGLQSHKVSMKVAQMIESKDDTTKYWLATQMTMARSQYTLSWGLADFDPSDGENAYGGWIERDGYLYNSCKGEGSSTRGVRAVVALSSDLVFTGSSDTSWSY